MSPLAYRLLAIVLQGLTGFLTYTLFCKLIGNKSAAFLGGAIFTFNIIQRNIVFYLSAIIYILVEIYAMSTIIFHMTFLENRKPRNYVISFIIFLLGISTHVSIAIVVPTLIYLTLRKGKRISKVLLFAPHSLLFLAVLIIEVYRGGTGRYTFNVYQSLRNIVTFTSALYYPFTPFGFTKAISLESTIIGKLRAMSHLFVSKPMAILMLFLSLTTLFIAFRSLFQKGPQKVGSVIFWSALSFYIPYHGISSRYINFGLLGISLILASFVAYNSHRPSRRYILYLFYVVIMTLLIPQPFLIYKEYPKYRKLASYCAIFKNYFSNKDFSYTDRIEISGVPDYSVEGSGLIDGLMKLIPRWTNNPDLKIEINPNQQVVGLHYVFEEPDKIIEVQSSGEKK